MEALLDCTLAQLGDGEIVRLESGDPIFKLYAYKKNPVVRPQDIGLTWYEKSKLALGAVFNSGAELFQDKVILAARCHRGYLKRTFFDKELGFERPGFENYISEIWPLVSEDGVHFNTLSNVVIRGDGTDHKDFTFGIEDIRIVKYNQKYLLIGCGKIKPPFKGKNADRIAIYSTKDFVNITYHGIVKPFDTRNAVSFFDFGNDRHYMLLRFGPNIHLARLEAGMDQLLHPSRHIKLWEKIYEQRNQNRLLEAGLYPHEREKIGPGTQVIETNEGWLLIYHAAGQIGDHIGKAYGLTEKIERGYSICAALLAPDDPMKVICRTRTPIYIPSAPYELHGNGRYPVDMPAVVFPVGAFVRKEKLILYAGAGDKYVILLSCNLKKLINYMQEQC